MPDSIASNLQLAAAAAALLCLIAAAIEDAWRYRISNLLVGGVVLAYALYAAGEMSWSFLGWSLAAAICMLLVAAAAFAFGIFGGGDAKLIAAMALWTQFGGLARFVVVMSALGGILGLVWIIRRRLGGRDRIPAAAPDGSAPDAEQTSTQPAPFAHLPYGIAIALAGIDFFLLAPNSPLAGWLPY